MAMNVKEKAFDIPGAAACKRSSRSARRGLGVSVFEVAGGKLMSLCLLYDASVEKKYGFMGAGQS